MKLMFKFFMWRVNVKTEKLGEEEKAKFLLNELVKTLQPSGKMAIRKNDGFGSANIWIHRGNTDKAEMVIENPLAGWEIKTKPNFKLMEVENNG